MDRYIPPFSISNKMLELTSSIMEKVGRLTNYTNLNRMPILRRNNLIKSIHSSLAIEANSLSLNQVRDVINNKMVIGPKKDIQEVKNAYNAYNHIKDYNPYSLKDLLKAQGYLTYLIQEDSGNFRKGNEGVFDGDKCIFMSPPPNNVPKLMEDLFEFLNENKNKIHPLILSSIFHYELVFIHPFSDGNGRSARLWQTVILSNYKEVFEYLPIESQIKDNQDEYYKSIAICNNERNSNVFIEFMLQMIDNTLEDTLKSSEKVITNSNIYVTKLLEVMDFNVPMTTTEIMQKLGLKSTTMH